MKGVEPQELKAEKLGGRFRVFSDAKRFTSVWPNEMEHPVTGWWLITKTIP